MDAYFCDKDELECHAAQMTTLGHQCTCIVTYEGASAMLFWTLYVKLGDAIQPIKYTVDPVATGL